LGTSMNGIVNICCSYGAMRCKLGSLEQGYNEVVGAIRKVY
jgi:hypothetical protein